MKSEEIATELGMAEDKARGLHSALEADEKYRSGMAPNSYTHYLAGLLVEATGKCIALRAILDFIQAAESNQERRRYETQS